MADKPIGPGAVLAGRFQLEDLLAEASGAKFWRATDQVLARNVAVHVISAGDPRADALLVAARTSATVSDGHFLRVLDAAKEDEVVYVVNEWGSGVSLDRLLEDGPLPARRAAWVVKEVAEAISTAHRQGIAHGRLLPENVMVSDSGSVKLIGFVIDAVLHGRSEPLAPGEEPPSDHETDVVNLAALLYAGLVGRWPGTETSALPAAPREHGRSLRPRQVRAGIPRPLDAVCDRVLNRGSDPQAMPLETAHEICAALSDYIGDPTGSAAMGYEPTSVLRRAELASPSPLEPETGTEPPQDADGGPPTAADQTIRADQSTLTGQDEPAAPQPQGAQDQGAQDPAAQATQGAQDQDAQATQNGQAGAERPSPNEDPDATQAGTPVFFDDDSRVGWLGAQSRSNGRSRPAPPPPPPLPEPEPKPLFAPDPPEGSPRRQPPAAPTSSRPGREPSTDTGGAHRTGPGTGSLPPVWGPDAEESDPRERGWDRPDAGKSWLRLGAAIALCLLLLVALVVAFQLGRSGGSEKPSSSGSPTASPSATHGKPVKIANVDDFDPQASPPEENPEEAPLAIDGDPSTAWRTMTYYGDPHLGKLKDGVGLVLDLGGATSVSEVRLTLVGQPTSLQILAAKPGQGEPTSTDGLRTVAQAEDAGTHVDLKLKQPISTRYLVVWLTSLPPAGGGYAGQVAEVSVRS